MHTDLSPHLHTPECNSLIDLLKKCHDENKFAKFFGACNTFDQQVVVCLKKERQERSRRNREQAREKHLQIRERMRQLDAEEASKN
ncbi:COX assembly mitochondrial protein 2 homolog [Toxorhynchites rutilus septentrionalis]|uniref:COX assembly mitochondrial protein 2 homolog n=1 Tax=Toxorhynchites rutilus septentrionalis TaxID=329112 RepID=UPI0024788016|nr:COX assembly mitochondrial protein 2 homolog [Toxorhynchites rutilus septentrionalis]